MSAEQSQGPPVNSGESPASANHAAPASPERDALIKGFLKSLKVSFKTASIYKLDHPAFHQAVTELMEKLEALFEFLSPLSIGFTPQSLYIDERFWEGERTYIDLGQLFHLRKIKGLVIHRGITLDELTRFAAKTTLPLTQFIKEGGALNLLKKEQIAHIELDILDYSQLLRGEGEEIKDIWPYLMMEAVEENDPEKLDLVAESFERVIGKFNTEDLVQNEELQKNFVKFFKYLKESSEDKHRACARDLLKSVLMGKKTTPEGKFENLKLLISDLTEEDLASTLWEEIIGNERFDSLSFSIFSKLISKERHKKISTSLRDLFQTDDPANRKADVEKKLKALLKGTSGQAISELYRQTLTSLLTEIDFETKMEFDRHELEGNYRYALLNMLAMTGAGGTPGKHLERISEEWERIAEGRDIDYLTHLLEVLQGREAELAGEPALGKVRRQLSELVEDWVLQGSGGPAIDGLVTALGESIFEPVVYLDAIFKARTVTATALRAYLTFFGSDVGKLKARIRRYSSASDLLEKIAGEMRSIDTPLSLDVLKDIYAAGDASVKVRALQAMQGLTEHDEPFLFKVLDARDMRLKAEALVLLTRHPRARHVALSKLLYMQSPYGMRNRKINRNIRMIEAKDVREAREFLETLGQRRDFWNRKVRQEALRVLEKWSEG
jgi:uncharacterized protein YceH (UPF0502 family)